MGNIWEFLLQTLTVSLTAAVLLIVKYLLADKLSPRWQYGIWGLLALRALIPAGMTRQVLLPRPAWVDMCKTAAAMLLGYLVLGDRGMAAAGMACMAGHCYPLLHGFKGGKGVSAGAAIALCIDWRAGLLTIAVFAIAALCSKKISFGSICAALSLPVWALVLELSQPRCALAIVGMCLVVIRHRENIKRLISGTEPDFKPGKSKRIERD